jgi:hypothetical protein
MNGERPNRTFIKVFMRVDKVRERNNSAGNIHLNLINLFPACKFLLAAGNNQSEAKDKM